MVRPTAHKLPPPPRRLGLALRIQALFGSVGIQLAVLFACVFFGVGVVFAFDSELMTPYEFQGPTATTAGTVREVYLTADEQKTMRVVEYDYLVDQESFAGISYALPDVVVPEGEPVIVEYPLQQPKISRIVGLQRRRFSGWVLVGPVPPTLIFLNLVGLQLWWGWQTLRSLRYGREHLATIEEILDAGTMMMSRIHTYVLAIDKETREAQTRGGPGLKEGQAVSALLDPEDPKRALLWETLPYGVIVVNGRLRAEQGPLFPLLGVVMSGLVGGGIVGLGWVFVFRRETISSLMTMLLSG